LHLKNSHPSNKQSNKKEENVNNNGQKRQINSKYAHMVRQIEVKNDKGQVIGTREVVFYPELLDAAHNEQLGGIETTLIQHPAPENGNTAIFTAKVRLGEKTFTGTGDANPDNVSPEIAKHFIRAAETRAKARALRDALNVPIVAVEELGQELANGTVLLWQVKPKAGTVDTGKQNGRKRKPKEDKDGEPTSSAVAPKPRIPDISPPANNGQKLTRSSDNSRPPADFMTDRQRKYIFHLLADQNLYGDEAHEYLKKLFKVESLNDVTKAQARELIDKLVKEAKELEEVPF
jgi:hypothetical protein